jgi:hypothetical protein
MQDITSGLPNSKPIDATKLTFADLPSEIRNIIYGQSLLYAGTLAFHSVDKAMGQMSSWANSPELAIKPILQSLALFRGISHQIRDEARSYFFCNNEFGVNHHHLKMDRGAPSDLTEYSRVLGTLGPYDRNCITRLDLWAPTVSLNERQEFSRQLESLSQLSFLKVQVDIHSLFGRDRATIINLLRDDGPMPVGNLQWFVKLFEKTVSLKNLTIVSDFDDLALFYNPPVHLLSTEQLGQKARVMQMTLLSLLAEQYPSLGDGISVRLRYVWPKLQILDQRTGLLVRNVA